MSTKNTNIEVIKHPAHPNFEVHWTDHNDLKHKRLLNTYDEMAQFIDKLQADPHNLMLASMIIELKVPEHKGKNKSDVD